MYQPLLPCPACHRHVRATEGHCPFCDAALPEGAAPRLAAEGESEGLRSIEDIITSARKFRLFEQIRQERLDRIVAPHRIGGRERRDREARLRGD